jgi:hypothetical protein
MRLAADVVRGVAESIRETLPGDDKEAGLWLGGFCWAFVLHWAIVLIMTYLWWVGQGRP